LKTLIIDADTILYQALSSAEREVEWEEDVWSLTCDHREARISFKSNVEYLVDESKASGYLLCFSAQQNFRYDIYPQYKSNRKKTRKPLGFLDFKSDVMEEYNSKVIYKPNLEADDCVGILGTQMKNGIIFSSDKDLLQIPGEHFIDGKLVEITEYEGDRFHMMQTLMGDTVDGYPGCPGIGKVKAEKILSESGPDSDKSWWEAVVDAYTKAGLTEADALVMARVSRILRTTDWDKSKGEPILWEPIPTTPST
jgi:DNA polymerase-1